ncbi:tetratricopeptide repeat protein [Clostridium sp. D2Q-14]|uniref:tetratricopeptide repeat protein n=1 Tax=Anaeromonas gelatinilytica TaxID=2683194 RepID=UPI00193C69AD|nr:tetratricopeptide repeat protein [Anaeromonas gelatinilytica]MBS4535301.1 tetratricopeptide repeat protein [Anaeromonas gelatinilytica]
MIKNIDEYFKEKTENIYFIQLKNDFKLKEGIEFDSKIPIPLVANNLLKEIKEGDASEEIKFKYIIEGIIYLLGIDFDFKHRKEYLDLLYSYNENIHGYILAEGIKKINDDIIEEGMIYLRALLNIDKENVKGLYSYGLALETKAIYFYNKNKIKEGNIFFRESTNQFETILDIDSSFDLTYYKLGYHYRNMKQYKKAQLIWEKFINMTSNDELKKEIELEVEVIKDDVKYEEGYNLILRGKSEEGLEKLLSLVKDNSDWWNLLFFIGLGYRQLGNYNEAIKYFNKVLIIEPKQVDALNEIGLCYANLKRFDEAISSFSKAIEIKPKDYQILCNRGMTYLQQGNLDEAENDIEKAYDMNPEDDIIIACRREINKFKNGI